MPSAIAVTSTLEVPTQFHPDLLNYVNAEMAMKDSNFNAAKNYNDMWTQSLREMTGWVKKRKRTDGFAAVQDEQQLADSYFGKI